MCCGSRVSHEVEIPSVNAACITTAYRGLPSSKPNIHQTRLCYSQLPKRQVHLHQPPRYGCMLYLRRLRILSDAVATSPMLKLGPLLWAAGSPFTVWGGAQHSRLGLPKKRILLSYPRLSASLQQSAGPLSHRKATRTSTFQIAVILQPRPQHPVAGIGNSSQQASF